MSIIKKKHDLFMKAVRGKCNVSKKDKVDSVGGELTNATVINTRKAQDILDGKKNVNSGEKTKSKMKKNTIDGKLPRKIYPKDVVEKAISEKEFDITLPTGITIKSSQLIPIIDGDILLGNINSRENAPIGQVTQHTYNGKNYFRDQLSRLYKYYPHLNNEPKDNEIELGVSEGIRIVIDNISNAEATHQRILHIPFLDKYGLHLLITHIGNNTLMYSIAPSQTNDQYSRRPCMKKNADICKKSVRKFINVFMQSIRRLRVFSITTYDIRTEDECSHMIIKGSPKRRRCKEFDSVLPIDEISAEKILILNDVNEATTIIYNSLVHMMEDRKILFGKTYVIDNIPFLKKYELVLEVCIYDTRVILLQVTPRACDSMRTGLLRTGRCRKSNKHKCKKTIREFIDLVSNEVEKISFPHFSDIEIRLSRNCKFHRSVYDCESVCTYKFE